MKRGPYIIIEGADGTGKTTLAEHLARRHWFTYAHCGPPETDALEFYLRKLRHIEGPVVTDRLHPGSWVYGQVFRSGADLTDFEEWLLDGYLMARGAVLVHCEVPSAVVEQNLARGPDSEDARIYEAPEKRAVVRELFEVYARERTALPVRRYDYTKDDMVSTADELSARVLVETGAAPNVEAIGNTVNPQLVLVGDRPNMFDRTLARDRAGGWDGRLLRRFAEHANRAVWNSQSGRYLFQALRAGGLALSDYCTFNSIQWDGRTVADVLDEEDGDKLAGLLLMADVVALGNLASEQLTAAGIQHRKVPHPQFVKRFHYKRVLEYAELLAGRVPFEEETWLKTRRQTRVRSGTSS